MTVSHKQSTEICDLEHRMCEISVLNDQDNLQKVKTHSTYRLAIIKIIICTHIKHL